jgi:hypothetical protein
MASRLSAVLALGAGCALALGLTGCGANSSGGSGSTAARDVKAAPPAEAGGAADAAGGPAQGAPAKVPDQLAPDSRSLVYTGTITVRVDNVNRAASDTATAATGAGGFVGGDERHSDDSRSEARMVLRVPSDKFASVIDAIARLGHEENRSLNTQDVTEQVADVDARLANAQASVDRIRALMAKATTIGEITSLESELSRREGDLESLKARKRKLDDLTALSTVTVMLLGKDAVKKQEEPKTGFLAGLRAGWKAFVTSMTILVTVLGAMLPWLAVLAIPGGVLFWLARRSRRGRPVPAPMPTPTPAAAPPVARPAAPVRSAVSAATAAEAPVGPRPAAAPEDPGPTR